MSVSKLTLKPSELNVEGRHLAPSNKPKILISDIKRIEIVDSNGNQIDSWGPDIKVSNKLEPIESSLITLKQGLHSFITVIYEDKGQIASVNVNKDLGNLSVISKDDGSVYLSINDSYLDTNKVFYLVPTIDNKSVGQYITITEASVCNGQSPFENANCYLEQYL
jgi:hypothetical protein